MKQTFVFSKNDAEFLSPLTWRYGNDPDAHGCEVSCYGEGHSNDAPLGSGICCLTHLEETKDVPEDLKGSWG